MSKLSKEKQQKIVLRGSRYIAIATQLPFVILAGYGIGYFLDTKLGTTWLSLVFLIAAIVGAFAQLIRQILKDQKSN